MSSRDGPLPCGKVATRRSRSTSCCLSLLGASVDSTVMISAGVVSARVAVRGESSAVETSSFADPASLLGLTR